MADIGASVLARLKNKAKESGRSYQLCLQLFCQEEFLRRLEKSKYAENLVLKGGLFIYSVTNFDSRVTVDIDFLLRRIPNTPEQFLNDCLHEQDNHSTDISTCILAAQRMGSLLSAHPFFFRYSAGDVPSYFLNFRWK